MGRTRTATDYEAELGQDIKKVKRKSQIEPKLRLQSSTTEVLLCRGAIATVTFSLQG